MSKCLIIICLCFSLIGCKTVNKMKTNHSDYENIPWQIQNSIQEFYYSYFRFPTTTDELIDYLWQWINAINDNEYASYSEFKRSNRIDRYPETGKQAAIDFLMKYKNDISITLEDSYCILKANDEGQMVVGVEMNLCEEKNDFMSRLRRLRSPAQFYNTENKLFQIDYEPEFSKGLKKIIERYTTVIYTEYKNKEIPLHMIFVYELGKELVSLCDPFPREGQIFIEELKEYCSDFLHSHTEINSLIFHTTIYKN